MRLRGKKYLWVLMVLMFLASMANVSIPTTSSPMVTFKVDTPINYEASPDNWITFVNVSITADLDTAVVGWRISIKVDPDVLEPGYAWPPEYVAWAGTSGFFLYDWCIANDWDPVPGEPPTLGPHDPPPPAPNDAVGIVNKTAGTITNTTESIKKWTDIGIGNGADGNGTLVMFYFTPKSLTAFSQIVITEAYYFTSWKGNEVDKRVPDVIINGQYNEALPGNIAGAVTDVDGWKLSSATVEAVGFETRSIVTKGDGMYELTGLVAGDYMVTASKGGYEDVTHPVTVETNKTTTCNFMLPPAVVLSVEVAHRKAWAKPIEEGTVTLNAIIQNKGNVPTNASVKFTIKNAAGDIQPPEEGVWTPVQPLDPGELYGTKVDYFAQWTTLSPGLYYGTAQAWYDTDNDGIPDTHGAVEKTFRISVKPWD